MAARKAAKKAAKKTADKITLSGLSTDKKGPHLELPDGEPFDIPSTELLLDPENLRLLERIDPNSRIVDPSLYAQPSIQNRIFHLIANDELFDVKSLVSSIVNNGFLKHERLIVVRYDSENYLVLEGNRRLTAVRSIFKQYGPELKGLSVNVRNSLQTIPCFVLKGPAIDDSTKQLKLYRKASEIYIGMRHLMGSKQWEPASRYEFQARLILEDGWTPDDVAERFGRTRPAVIRDLKAQRLYHDFRDFERSAGVEHSLTYNAFAEAARASSVMKWLEWSDKDLRINNKENEKVLFYYLTNKLHSRQKKFFDDGEEESAQESAESIVRHLRDMLKLNDELILDALSDLDFNSADLLFQEKREGVFAKRVANFTRKLKRLSEDELSETPQESKDRLVELIKQATRTIALIDTLIKFD